MNANEESPIKHLFTGHEHDSESGFIYMKARYYDPEICRFLSVDPPIYEGSYFPTGDKKKDTNLPGYGGFYNYINANAYIYAANSPVVYTDPNGKYIFIRVKSKIINSAIDTLRNAGPYSTVGKIISWFDVSDRSLLILDYDMPFTLWGRLLFKWIKSEYNTFDISAFVMINSKIDNKFIAIYTIVHELSHAHQLDTKYSGKSYKALTINEILNIEQKGVNDGLNAIFEYCNSIGSYQPFSIFLNKLYKSGIGGKKVKTILSKLRTAYDYGKSREKQSEEVKGLINELINELAKVSARQFWREYHKGEPMPDSLKSNEK